MNIRKVTLLFTIFLAGISSLAWADSYRETKHMVLQAGVGDMFETSNGDALLPFIGNASMIQASFGFQLGGLGFSQVVFFQDRRALHEFISGTFEFGIKAQATVLTLQQVLPLQPAVIQQPSVAERIMP